MVTTRIIPGVSVSVVKEVVPKQLAPTGVLGLVGLAEESDPASLGRAGSWTQFVVQFGRGSAYSMPEARQALDNGVFELVVTPVNPSTAAKARATLRDETSTRRFLFNLDARVPGTWANGIEAVVENNAPRDPQGVRTFNLSFYGPGPIELERHNRLTTVPGTPRYVVDVLERDSSIAVASAAPTLAGLPAAIGPTPLIVPDGETLGVLTLQDDSGRDILAVRSRAPTPELAASVERTARGARIAIYTRSTSGDFEEAPPEDLDTLAQIEDLAGNTYTATPLAGTSEFLVVPQVVEWPAENFDMAFEGGKDASAQAYRDALVRLEDVPDVDMVLATVQDFSNTDRVVQIYSSVISHCQNMSDDCKGRIGFGQVPPNGDLASFVEMAGNLVSDRFVLTAPHRVVGVVAGLVGNLAYFHSPTFKTVSGLGALRRELTTEEQRQLLRGNIVPVAVQEGLGIVVLRGLTTDGDQISVRRVADRAVRGVKSIGTQFIGRLNNADGRSSLRQKITEFFLQMEKEGAIVPSTDGSDPSFKVDVYSSQRDFALGIVRVDIAVRPVRAIDFIYATILVQV